MIEYGTNVVGGVTPGKGGQTHLKNLYLTQLSFVIELGEHIINFCSIYCIKYIFCNEGC